MNLVRSFFCLFHISFHITLAGVVVPVDPDVMKGYIILLIIIIAFTLKILLKVLTS